MFESKGFLCRHALVVFQYAAVPEILSHYILKRWTVDAKSNYSKKQGANELKSREQQYNDLCQRAWKFLESGSKSQESYNVAIHALEEATNHCLAVNNFIKNVPKPHESGTRAIHNINKESQCNSAVTTLWMLDFLLHKTGGASKAGVDKKKKRYNTSQKSNERLSSSSPPYDVCDWTQQRMEEHGSALSKEYSMASAVSHPVQQRLEGSSESSYGTWTMDGKENIHSNSVPP